MDPPVSRFIDKAITYLEQEVLPDISNNFQYYPFCQAKPLNGTKIRVQDLLWARRNVDDEIEIVNDNLRSDRVVFEFHLNRQDGWGDWENIIHQFSIVTDCHHHDIPYAIKWESGGSAGVLKADERWDDKREILRERIAAGEAMRVGLESILHEYLPKDIELLGRSTDLPIFVRRIFDQDDESFEKLKYAGD